MIIKRNSKTKPPPSKRTPSGSIEEQKPYHSVTWRKLRLSLLKHEPLCRVCKAKGIIKQATVADHLIPARITSLSFYDSSNLQPLCAKCHDKKSRDERKLY